MNIFRNHRKLPSDRYSLGLDIADPKRTVTIPRSAHLAVIGESNSGKGSVIANIISQEVAFGGEIWFIDLKAGMEAENYCNVLARKAYTLEEAYDLLTDFNSNVDTLAAEWRGKTRSSPTPRHATDCLSSMKRRTWFDRARTKSYQTRASSWCDRFSHDPAL